MALPNPYDDEYMACDLTFATLVFSGLAEHPSTVSERLGVEPTAMHVLGGKAIWKDGGWQNPPPGGRRRPWQRHKWMLSTLGSVASKDSLRHVDHVLAQLDGRDAAVVSLLSEGWHVGISIFWSSHCNIGGPRLIPATMRRLTELDIPIEYEFFSEANHGSVVTSQAEHE